MASTVLALELGLDRNPFLVSPTRRYVEDMLERLIADPDFVGRVGLAVHELVENATKYARDGARIRLSVVVRGGPDAELVVQLTNRTTPPHIDRLKQFLSEINGTGDAMGLYMDMMCRNPFDNTVSGLGLARIRAEGEMALNLVTDADFATIVATAAPPQKEAMTWVL